MLTYPKKGLVYLTQSQVIINLNKKSGSKLIRGTRTEHAQVTIALRLKIHCVQKKIYNRFEKVVLRPSSTLHRAPQNFLIFKRV